MIGPAPLHLVGEHILPRGNRVLPLSRIGAGASKSDPLPTQFVGAFERPPGGFLARALDVIPKALREGKEPVAVPIEHTVVDELRDALARHFQRPRSLADSEPQIRQLVALSGKAYRCGLIAAMALDEFIGASPVSCRERDTDRYGRTVPHVCVASISRLGSSRMGTLAYYRRYSNAYIGAEQEERKERDMG